MKYYLLIFLLFGMANLSFSQQKVGEGQIELIKAENLEVKNGLRYIKSGKNTPRVVFKRDSSYLYCDVAIQNPETKSVNAYGKVVIEEASGAVISADTLLYNNTTNVAEFRSNVVLVDSTTTLTTSQLFYDLNVSSGYYLVGGKVQDNGNVLTSKKGYYRSANQSIAFKGDVVLDDTQNARTLETDTLTYYTETKDAFFHAATKITSKEGVLNAGKGKYNTETTVTTFEENATADSEDYILKGQHMFSDRDSDQNIVKGDVELYSKKEFATAYGDQLIYKEQSGWSKIFGGDEKYALMKRPFGEEDTLFLAADTILTINDTINNIRQLHAYYGVKLLTGQMQGTCDSLVYDYNDSTITLFQDPIMWSAQNQIKAENIKAFLSNNNIDSLHLTSQSFIIQKDTLENYNQIKGRNMIAYFNKSDLSMLDVNGNCQTLYFMLEADTITVGMNKVDCGKMLMTFGDSSRLENISFNKSAEGKFIPMHELLEPDTRLKDFRLRFNERPEKAIIVSRKREVEVPGEEEEKNNEPQKAKPLKGDLNQEKNPNQNRVLKAVKPK